jgi:hypothetical protein
MRLSKIAHMRRLRLERQDQTKPREASAYVMRRRLQTDARRRGKPFWLVRVGQVELAPTIKADLICTEFDRKHTADMSVAAAENKLEYAKEQFHKSCARWRRSQLPLASNHSSSDRTLVRARAIAQSAAP